MPRKLKCQICDIKDEQEKVKIKKGYCHQGECYDKHLKQEEIKQKEQKQKHELYETIKRLHKIDVIPHQFFAYIEDLRNGNMMFGQIEKRYKKGFSYDVIEKTYKYCNSQIDWALDVKDFKGSTMNMLKYTLAIVKDKINFINKKIKNQQIQEKQMDKASEIMRPDDKDIEYKKQENKHDISRFLD